MSRDTVTDALGVLMNLVSHANPDVRTPALTHLGLSEPPESLQETLEAARRHYLHLLYVRPNTSEEELEHRLARNVLFWLASSEQVSVALLEELAAIPDPGLRRTVAERTDAPMAVLGVLAQDKQSKVRETVGSNPHTPPETLIKLAGDENQLVRFVVATNPSTPVKALVRLAGDKMGTIRKEVAHSLKVADDDRLALAVRLAAQYAGDPDGLKAAVDAVLV